MLKILKNIVKIQILTYTFKNKFSRYSNYSITFLDFQYYIEQSKTRSFIVFRFSFGDFGCKFGFKILNKNFAFYKKSEKELERYYRQGALADYFDSLS